MAKRKTTTSANDLPLVPYLNHWSVNGTSDGREACDGKTRGDCAIGADGWPVARVQDNGKPSPDDMRRIRNYQKVEARAEKLLGITQ